MVIMERNLAFEQDPEGFAQEWQPREEELAHQVDAARRILPEVKYTRADLATIAMMMADFVRRWTPRRSGDSQDRVAHAAWEERIALNDRDIMVAAQLALPTG
jgi:Mg-chelatase subunit ChlI